MTDERRGADYVPTQEEWEREAWEEYHDKPAPRPEDIDVKAVIEYFNDKKD